MITDVLYHSSLCPIIPHRFLSPPAAPYHSPILPFDPTSSYYYQLCSSSYPPSASLHSLPDSIVSCTVFLTLYRFLSLPSAFYHPPTRSSISRFNLKRPCASYHSPPLPISAQRFLRPCSTPHITPYRAYHSPLLSSLPTASCHSPRHPITLHCFLSLLAVSYYYLPMTITPHRNQSLSTGF